MTKDDLDLDTGAVSPRTKSSLDSDTGSEAQSAMKSDPERDLRAKLIHFLYNFGVVIDENDPYANLHIQTAVSELVDTLEGINGVNHPEASRLVNGPRLRVNMLEKGLYGSAVDSSDVRGPRGEQNLKDTQFINTATKLRHEIKDGNGNAKLSYTGDSLHETSDGIDSESSSSVDSEDVTREQTRRVRFG